MDLLGSAGLAMPTARKSGAFVSIYGSRLYYASSEYRAPGPSKYSMSLLEVYTPAFCDASSAPTNGGVGTCTSSLPVGSTCQPVCDSGYTVSGATLCVAAASSSASLSAATCVAACNSATPPTNGLVGTCSSTLPAGSTCQPSCNSGYSVSGLSS